MDIWAREAIYEGIYRFGSLIENLQENRIESWMMLINLL
jgi:hypothetical protein